MEILESLEVRWFLPDGSKAARAARSQFRSVASEGQRVDHYLLCDRDDLGVKARIEKQSSKLETKYRVGALGVVLLAPRVQGKLERWSKLSLAVEDPELRKDGAWLAVQKDRRLRKFAFRRGRTLEVPAKSRPDAGCGFELTQLHYRRGARSRVEWSIGLEAFGPATALLEVFQAACRLAFDRAALALGFESSMGYPEWLQALERGTAGSR